MSTKSITKELRDLIVDKIKNKISRTIIAKQLKISLASVYRIEKNPQIQKRGPKKQNENKFIKFQLHQAVKRLTKLGEKVSVKKIQDIIPQKVEIRTLQRRLKADPSLVYRNMQKKIRLNSVQESNRVEIIKEWFKESMF